MNRFGKLASVSTLSLAVAMGAAHLDGGFQSLFSAAWAQSSGGGQGSSGSQSGQSNQGGQGTGQAGPGPDSDSKGPQAGGPSSTGSGGGKPVWAQEGIPEVELGRLSVARSPEQVLDRALLEADATLTADMVSFYNQSLDDIIEDLSLNWDSVTFFDSPLQNLALYADVLEDGKTVLDGVSTTDPEKLLAIFLGVASDKNVPITEDTVIAITTILGANLDTMIAINVEDVAADAEAVRIAILAGHG